MTSRHLVPVPEPRPPAGPAPIPSGGVAADLPSGLAGDALTRMFLRARSAGARITVERFERDDGTQVIYLDASDVVAFIYTGHRAGSHSGLDPVVVDLHRRTEAGERRLHLMVDDTDAQLLTVDPSQFVTAPSSVQGGRGWDLVCARCERHLGPLQHGGLLQSLLDLASAHTCADRIEPGGTLDGSTGTEPPCR